MHKSVAMLVLPKEVEVLLTCNRQYADHPDAVHEVVQSGEFGALMYSFAVADIVAKNVMVIIEEYGVALISVPLTVD